MTDQKRSPVVKKIKNLVFDKRLDRVLDLSSSVLDICFKAGGAIKNPLILIPVIGSVLGVARKAFQDTTSDSRKFIERMDLVDSKSDLGVLLYASGVSQHFEIDSPVKSSGDEESISCISVDEHSKIWIVTGSSGGVRLFVKRGDTTTLRKLVNQLFQRIGGVGIEVTKGDGYGESGFFSMKPIPPMFIDHEIDLQISLANSISSYWRTNESPAYVFQGPGGTGKTTLGLAVAALMGLSVVMIGPQALYNLNTKTLYELINALEPGLLIIDDVDKAGYQSMFYTALNSLRSAYPKMIIIMSMNDMSAMSSAAFFRPGRAGEIWFFEAPSFARKCEIFADNCVHKHLDVPALCKMMVARLTHDWIVGIAKKCSRAIGLTQDGAEAIVKNMNTNYKVVERMVLEDNDKIKTSKTKPAKNEKVVEKKALPAAKKNKK